MHRRIKNYATTNDNPRHKFIEKLDKNKNYIFVAHHTTIEGLVNKFANSGEMIIVDRSYKIVDAFKVN